MATFSRHTCPPIFIGMTADQNDILVSLSPNLNRFFSRTFSTDARSDEFRRPRCCGKVSDPIIIFAQPVSTIPFPGQEFNIVLSLVFFFFSNEQRCSQRLRILSSMEPCLLSKQHRGSSPGLKSQKYASLSVFLTNAHFSSTVGFLFHLFCCLVTAFVGIFLPNVPLCHID